MAMNLMFKRDLDGSIFDTCRLAGTSLEMVREFYALN